MSDAHERLFFAIWPDEPLRDALVAWQGSPLPGKGRWIVRDNLHLTLLFLGRVGRELRDCLCTGVSAQRLVSCELVLDQLGVWRRPEVAWLGTAGRIDPALERLVASLREVAEQCGLPPEERPFVPHLTLARKVRTLPDGWRHRDPPSIRHRVSEIALVRSETRSAGAVYETVQRWPLLNDE